MDLAGLVVVLGAAFVYVAIRYTASRRPSPPPEPAQLVGAPSKEVPTADRFTHDPMGVIRTSNPGRLLPRSPFVILALVVLTLAVLVNVPLR